MPEGPSDAVSRVLPLVYEELHALSRRMQADRAGSLHVTSVVHDAFLRLSRTEALQWESVGHFKAIAAKAMRHVLADRARAREADKRGGGWHRVSTAGLLEDLPPLDLYDLNRALDELAGFDPRGAEVLELRLLGGLTHTETAEVLACSVPTVERDWRAARAWLLQRLEL